VLTGLKAAPTAKVGDMLEPGLDKHEWESLWQSVEEDFEESPAEALPEADRLVEQMLEARGYAMSDPVVREGDDRDIVAEFVAAREVTRLVEQGAEGVSPGDIAAAINGYRSLYQYLIVERSPP
jgi:hypothetical protein